MDFLPRFFDARPDHFFLLGPRGTGKTLWTQHRSPDALRIDLLDPAVHREFAARPERLREVVEGNPDRPQVVVDEVQKLPELLEMVHLLTERMTGQQFVLTGSSARKLRREGVNLLGGRAANYHLHPGFADAGKFRGRLPGKPALPALSGERAAAARRHSLPPL